MGASLAVSIGFQTGVLVAASAAATAAAATVTTPTAAPLGPQVGLSREAGLMLLAVQRRCRGHLLPVHLHEAEASTGRSGP